MKMLSKLNSKSARRNILWNATLHARKMNDISSLKVSELRALCKERGLSGYSKARKNQLIEMLLKQ